MAYTDKEWEGILKGFQKWERVEKDWRNMPSIEVRKEAARRLGIKLATIGERLSPSHQALPIRQALTKPGKDNWKKRMEQDPELIEAARRLNCPVKAIVRRITVNHWTREEAMTRPYDFGRAERTRKKNERENKARSLGTFLQWPVRQR